jgi:hypothetical protein
MRELRSGGLTQAKWAAGFHVGGRRRNLLGRVPLNRTGESHGRPRGLYGVDNAGKGVSHHLVLGGLARQQIALQFLSLQRMLLSCESSISTDHLLPS